MLFGVTSQRELDMGVAELGPCWPSWRHVYKGLVCDHPGVQGECLQFFSFGAVPALFGDAGSAAMNTFPFRCLLCSLLTSIGNTLIQYFVRSCNHT